MWTPFCWFLKSFEKNMTWHPTGQKSIPKMKVSGVDETPQKARPPQKYLWMEPIVDLPIINLLLPRCFYFRHASEGGISLDGGSKLHIFGAKNNFKQQFLAVKLEKLAFFRHFFWVFGWFRGSGLSALLSPHHLVRSP